MFVPPWFGFRSDFFVISQISSKFLIFSGTLSCLLLIALFAFVILTLTYSELGISFVLLVFFCPLQTHSGTYFLRILVSYPFLFQLILCISHGSVFVVFLYFLCNTFHPFLWAFFYYLFFSCYLCCLVITSGLLFGITIINIYCFFTVIAVYFSRLNQHFPFYLCSRFFSCPKNAFYNHFFQQ